MAATASGAERAAGGPSLQHVVSALGHYVKIQGTDELEHLDLLFPLGTLCFLMIVQRLDSRLRSQSRTELLLVYGSVPHPSSQLRPYKEGLL